MDDSATLTTKVEKLCLKATPLDTTVSKAKSKKVTAVADSWDDEDISSGAENDEKDGHEPRSPIVGKPGILAPPPTPITAGYTMTGRPFAPIAPTFEEEEERSGAVSPRSEKNMDLKRPEKTDAVVRRMIASALGVKVPRMTDEQKAYDKALREKERKRKEQNREMAKRQEEEAAKAKQAVWED